jgi:phosphate transport system ATP-binding protein
MMNKLEISELNFYYGELQALKNINIGIRENKITALIGPSGCGKTTFLKTINRMTDFVEGARATGHILYNGQDTVQDDIDVEALRMKVGMVFQKPNPFPKSIYENVIYGPKRHGIKKKHDLDLLVERSLKQAALWEEVKGKLHQSALSLSGGQQQRLCIARTLSMEPEILLMDEPTSALDPLSTLKIEDLMAQLKQSYTIIIVTHSMQQAARISDDTAFFLLGEIIESGTTSGIFTNAKNKKTEDYISGRFGCDRSMWII